MNNKNIYKVIILIIISLFIYIEKAQTEIQEIEVVENHIQQEQPQENKKYLVNRVVDGDTIKIDKIGTVRLIGIDTPETVDPRKEVQCFGIEASNKAKELLEGNEVILELDPSQGDVDKYGRILAYVYLENGEMFNKIMIKEGYAHEYTYNTPYKYQAKFKELEQKARELKLGLWGPICNSN